MKLKLFGALLATIAVSGCNCGGSQTNKTGGQLDVKEANLDFGKACPKPTDPQYQVTPPTGTIHLHNSGTTLSNVNTFAVDAAYADVFVVDPTTVPATLGAGADAAVTITFYPKAAGTVQATLTIQGDQANNGDKHQVTLVGEGLGFDPVPEMSMSCTGDLRFPTMDGCAVSPPHLDFGDTSVNGTGEVVLTLKNGGCPTLSIDSLAVTTTTGAAGTFALATGQATTATVLGANASPTTIKIDFKPQDVDDFEGQLTFNTNDPTHKTITMRITGSGAAPALRLSTAIGCGAPDPSQDNACCDFAAKSNGGKFPCTGVVDVINDGNSDLTITKVYIKNSSSQFQLGDTSALIGAKVPGAEALDAGAVTVTVSYVPGPDSQTDTLVVESSGGNAELALRGGSPPVLNAQPADTLDFSQGITLDHTDYYLPLTLTNTTTYNQQLDLTIKDLVLTQQPATFDVITSGNMPATCAGSSAFTKGTIIKAGDSFQACVHFKSDSAGGSFAATLNVLSNDPAYPDGPLCGSDAGCAQDLCLGDGHCSPDGLTLTVTARASCLNTPTAAIEILAADNGGNCPCSPEACPATASCGVLLPANGPGSLVVSAAASFIEVHDFDLNGHCVAKSCAPPASCDTGQTCVGNICHLAPATYKWTLPAQDPGDDALSSAVTPTTTFTFSKAQPHALQLNVSDAAGTKSSTTSFTVNVGPHS